MTVTNVDDCEKWLVRLPLFPAVDRACSFTNIPRIVIITTTDIVVRLAGVGGVIAGLSQQIRILGNPVVRNFITAYIG
jgi:hypothetical protein